MPYGACQITAVDQEGRGKRIGLALDIPATIRHLAFQRRVRVQLHSFG